MLDAHIVIWATAEPARVGEAVRNAILAPENQLFISSATVWEIAIKSAARRLVFPVDEFDAVARRLGAGFLPILPTHAMAAAALPRHHSDPFDRMLIAQANIENLTLVTADRAIAHYDVSILRV